VIVDDDARVARNHMEAVESVPGFSVAAVAHSASAALSAVERHKPELIVCPILKKIIPESIFTRHRCLIVHPGPVGDRGPSSLDWAIELGADEWGVTVLEANGEVDAGDVWATRAFRMRAAGKSSLYRHEVRRAATDALLEAVLKVVNGGDPEALDYGDPRVTGRARPVIAGEAPCRPSVPALPRRAG
jgi:putative two-component system hydrogenase maturation factor HypX/HoxX